MTLAVYPLVYLPVAASLRSADPGQEEVARSLGLGPGPHLRRGSRSARPGAPSSAAACWSRWSCWPSTARSRSSATRRSPPRSSPSSTCLQPRRPHARCPWCWSCSACWCWPAKAPARGRGRVSRTGPLAQRVIAAATGWAGPRCRRAGLFAVLVLLALGVPVGAGVYWMVEGGAHGASPGPVSLLDAAWHTAGYSGAAAALATVMALPVALLAVRHRGRLRHLLERSTYLVLAMPGRGHRASPCPTSPSATRPGSATRAPRCCSSPTRSCSSRWRWSASRPRWPRRRPASTRSPGRWASAGWRCWSGSRCRWSAPGLAAAFCLVFLSAVTELTATLAADPDRRRRRWPPSSGPTSTNLSYGQAAPFALVMIVVAAVPSYVLGRFFDPLRRRRKDDGMRHADGHRPGQGLRHAPGADGRGPRGAGRIADGDPRPVRQREDHPAAAAGRLRAGGRRHGRGSATAGRRPGRPRPRRSGAASATSRRKAACSRI